MNDQSGIACLTLMLRFHGIPADAERLSHGLGGRQVGVPELVRGARDHGLKAQSRAVSAKRLGALVLPAIIRQRDGRFQILAKVVEGDALVHDAVSGQPRALARKDFLDEWDGTVILMTRRASLSDLARRFDLGWFLQAMHKYRRLLAEVLLASFFLQVFSLITPLFFQVVIDKVLVHRGLTTLDVLVIGLIAVSIFESLLSGLRTYVFSHTTNRIDIELGARLSAGVADRLFRGTAHRRFRRPRP